MVETAIAMLMLVAGPDAMKQNREAFARCLKDVVKTSIDKKVDAAAFTSSLDGSCKDKEQALRATLLAAEKKLGVKPAAAEMSADEQILDYRVVAKEDFVAAPKQP